MQFLRLILLDWSVYSQNYRFSIILQSFFWSFSHQNIVVKIRGISTQWFAKYLSLTSLAYLCLWLLISFFKFHHNFQNRCCHPPLTSASHLCQLYYYVFSRIVKEFFIHSNSAYKTRCAVSLILGAAAKRLFQWWFHCTQSTTATSTA